MDSVATLCAAQLAGKPSMMNPEGGVAMTGHNHGGNQNTTMTNMPVNSKKTAISDEAKKSLVPLFDSYFKMKNALVNDDFEKAKAAGNAINSSLSKVDMNLFKGDAHTLWMQQSSALKQSTQHLEHLSDIKALRASFIEVSRSMIAIAESFVPITTPVYVQHCPMADSNKGADWLNNKEEIHNPYFGQAMLTCGEVTKTID